MVIMTTKAVDRVTGPRAIPNTDSACRERESNPYALTDTAP